MELLTNASVVAKLSLIVAIVPLGAGITYAIWPTEQRLALLRPLSLAGLFAALTGFVLGVLNILRAIGISSTPVDSRIVATGMAEAFVTLFVAFACLTVAWLCAALGLRRHA